MFDTHNIPDAPLAHCYDAHRIYTYSEPCGLDPLESQAQGKAVWVHPADSLLTPPPEPKDGHERIAKDDTWDYVENHIGREGYVDGVYTRVAQYGPLPDGWSDTPPPPTTEELMHRLRSARDGRLSATDKYLMPDYPISPAELADIKAYRQALRDLPAQPGAPWDGGGELTPWPELPSVE